MKYLSLYFIFTLLSFQSDAQETVMGSLEDSIQVKKSIAVVPFMPQMYYNDLSRLWYKTGESNCQEKQIKEIGQHLVKFLNQGLGADCEIIDLNLTQTVSTTDFLLEYYLLGKIAYADTFPQKETKLKWTKQKSHKNKNAQSHRGGELYSERENRAYQFLNFNIRDAKRFRELCKELEVDQVLFINQFDVKGDFGSPYNSGRETDYFINIHYSLYDKKGNLLLGNKTKVATTNEKARYQHFLDLDLRSATSEIITNILNRNKLISLEKRH